MLARSSNVTAPIADSASIAAPTQPKLRNFKGGPENFSGAPPEMEPAEAEPPMRVAMAMRSEAAPPAAAGDPHGAAATPPITAAEEINEDFSTVKVFYGTDRLAMNLEALNWRNHLSRYRNATLALLAGVLVGCSVFIVRYRKTAVVLTIGCLLTAGGLATMATQEVWQVQRAAAKSDRMYTGERGTLELGTCRVSIPRDHRVGELEAPSLLRLEVSESPEKHVVLLNITKQEEGTFYDELAERVANSRGKDAFVFVHGYNVKFEDAVRRTAQIAYDLKFDGAPICYSWPSQAKLLGYTVDETNVKWTVPHLKQFLLDVSKRSGATTINLIAHSMGNRALTAALKEVAQTETQQTPLFNKVVLAAPDIDAEIFRRDLAPAVVSTANHVTLYASSNDEALVASKRVHGFPRAGESGEGLVIVEGIDTIDVSAIDTSLLGHSYYGSSDSILTDLYHLINDALPANRRQWLQPMFRDGLTYWVFQAGVRDADESTTMYTPQSFPTSNPVASPRGADRRPDSAIMRIRGTGRADRPNRRGRKQLTRPIPTTAAMIFIAAASGACRTTADFRPSHDASPPANGVLHERIRRATEGLAFENGRVSPAHPKRPRPSHAAAEFQQGRDLMRQNRRFAAARRFANAILADPQFAEAYDGLGQALWRRGAVEQAVAAYRTALDLQPNLHVARKHLAVALAADARFDQAISQWRTLLDRDPTSESAHARLAVSYYYTGDHASAWKHVHLAEALNSPAPPQLVHLLEQRAPQSK